jgi:hypothetical protein
MPAKRRLKDGNGSFVMERPAWKRELAMTIDPTAYGPDWVAAWNRRDIDAVLAHYAEDAVFVSPKAVSFTGAAEIRGKTALRHYWTSAAAKIRSLVFTFDSVLWDPATQVLAVIYVATLDGVACRAVETIEIGPVGLIMRGEAFYGATIAADQSNVDA